MSYVTISRSDLSRSRISRPATPDANFGKRPQYGTARKKRVFSFRDKTLSVGKFVAKLLVEISFAHQLVHQNLMNFVNCRISSGLNLLNELLFYFHQICHPSGQQRLREVKCKSKNQKRNHIHPTELASEPTIVRSRCEILSETSRFFTDHNVRPRLVFNTTQDERALSMVAAGVGFTTMPDHYELDGVKRIKMIGYDFEREIGLVKTSYQLSEERNNLVGQFINFAKSHLPEITYES